MTTHLDHTTSDHEEIGHQTLRRLAEAWPRRATVRSDGFQLGDVADHRPEIPDYPTRFLPFAEHPDYVDASDRQKQDVLTMGWLVYNERVVTAEEEVANPTFARIVHGKYPGASDPAAAEAIQQAHVDETWHTYMHMLALRRTREVRRLDDEPDYPTTVTHRSMLEAQAECDEQWQRDLLALVWTAVSEISVNAYLELLSRDEAIQPMHSLVTRLHARDESAHGPVMVEVCKKIYAEMNAEQRAMFARAVPMALHAFVVQDFAVWPLILRAAGFGNAEDIVEDSRRVPGNSLLVRDFSGVEKLIRAMNLDVEIPG